MTQSETLLAALRRGEALTTLDALQKYNVMAVSQRMTELQRKGFPIRSEIVKTPTGKHVARYSWAGQLELIA